MNRPLVTIGIPVYNEAGHLARCLDSVVAELPGRLRIVVADNASTDGTGQIVRDYAARYPHLEYVRHLENLGATANFRYVLERAQTPYFLWLAGDDRVEPGFIERAVSFLDGHSDHLCVTGASRYYDQHSGTFQLATSVAAVEDDDPVRRVERFILNLTDNSEFYALYRRTALELAHRPVLGADWIAMMRFALKGKLGALPGVAFHRTNRWDIAGRPQDVARQMGVPIAQAERPHYAIALYAFLEFALMAENLEGLGARERLSLAVRVLRAMKATQNLPPRLDFWPDARRMFGEEFVREQGRGLRKHLAALWLELTREGARPDDMAPLIEAALMLRLWDEAPDAEEAQLLDSRPFQDRLRVVPSLGRFALGVLFRPSFQLKDLPELPQVPVELAPAYVSYLNEAPALFEKDEDIERYADHAEWLIEMVGRCTTSNIEASALRLPAGRAALLAEFMGRFSVIPCYFSSRNLRPLMEKRAALAQRWLATQGAATDGWKPAPRTGARKKIGLILTTLNSLTDTYDALPAIAHLDRSRYEILIYTLSVTAEAGPGSPMEQHASTLCDRLMLLKGAIPDMVQAIRQESLDVALIGGNTTAVTHQLFLLSLFRLGRVQIAFSPCCVTTGNAASTDIFVSGRLLEPEEGAQEAYSERLWLLDGPGHTRLVPPFEAELMRPRPAPRRTDGEFRLVSGANYFKLTPGVRKTWLRILAQVPRASLTLYPFGPAWTNQYDGARLIRLLEEDAKTAGVDSSRVKFAGPFQSMHDISNFLAQTDVYLDSFPFSGINSLIDPLVVGIPVVALQGGSFRSSMGASVLRDLEMTELFARDVDDYVAVVRKLGEDAAYLRACKDKVFRAMSKPPKFLDSAWCSAEFDRLFRSLD